MGLVDIGGLDIGRRDRGNREVRECMGGRVWGGIERVMVWSDRVVEVGGEERLVENIGFVGV